MVVLLYISGFKMFKLFDQFTTAASIVLQVASLIPRLFWSAAGSQRSGHIGED